MSCLPPVTLYLLFCLVETSGVRSLNHQKRKQPIMNLIGSSVVGVLNCYSKSLGVYLQLQGLKLSPDERLLKIKCN